jgi:large exoprotein involved in heme utilization and adhesion
VTQPNSRVIIDLDKGITGNAATDVNARLFLFNRGTGEVLQVSDFALSTGDSGSLNLLGIYTLDPAIDIIVKEPGVYLAGVALGFVSRAGNNELISGGLLKVGQAYTLNVSVENQGTSGVTLPPPLPNNTANFNPLFASVSGVLSKTSGTGHAGLLSINTGQLTLADRARVSTESAGQGNAGTIDVNVNSLTRVDRGTLSTTSSSSGNGGNLRMNTAKLEVVNSGALQTNAFGTGTSGDLFVTARESIFLDSDPEIFNLVGDPSLFTVDFQGQVGDAGSIFVETPSLRLLGGSQFRTGSFGRGTVGDVNISASSIEAIGTLGILPTGIFADNFGSGAGGNIIIDTDRLSLFDGANIAPRSRSSTSEGSGSVIIRASELVEVIGAEANSQGSTTISVNGEAITSAAGAATIGRGGSIFIETETLRIAQGGRVSASTSGSGIAGSIIIQATDVEVSDVFINPNNNFVSGLSVAVEQGATGGGGDLKITADRLRVTNGGQITASGLGSGQAGNITLQVGDIDVTGISDTGIQSRVSAFAIGSAAAGSINISADQLSVRNGGEIGVSNTSGGDAGNLTVNANQIILKDGGSLRAEVAAGSQGNILLTARDYVLMRRQGLISTNATGTATGGNITINSPIIIGLENSDIVANAVQGAGGNIQISTQLLLGLQFRPFLTPENDITASSQFGLSGTVVITTPNVSPNADAVELPSTLIDPTQQVGQGCNTYKDSRFVATGRGGLPENPRQRLTGRSTWTDVREVSQSSTSRSVVLPQAIHPAVVEATGWHKMANGKVELFATGGAATHIGPPMTCPSDALSSR